MKKGWWQTRDGKTLKIKDMDTIHIYNCMRFLIGGMVIDPVFNVKWSDKTMVKYIKYFDAKYKEFENEFYKRRKDERENRGKVERD